MIAAIQSNLYLLHAVISESLTVPRPSGSGPRWPLPDGRGTDVVCSTKLSFMFARSIFSEAPPAVDSGDVDCDFEW